MPLSSTSNCLSNNLFAILIYLCLVCISHGEEVNVERFNVVLIVTDDQGWADIGYNNPKVYSPHLDRLAAEGVTLTQNYVMPQCTPTRVALMTGRYPSRFGRSALQASNEPAFPLGTPTISQMFRDSGYETCLCGKWHLGSYPEHGPNHFGFDHSYGSLAGAVGMYDHRYRKGKFFNTWHRNHKLIEGSENGTHATDLIVGEATRIIETERKKPFFLYLPLHSVHTPLDERGQFVDTPTQRDPDDSKRWLNEDRIKWFNDPQGIVQQETDPEKRLFLAAVNHMDDAIGKVVAALDKSGQREHTMIVFSSDNGPQGSWGGKAYPNDLKLTSFNQKLPMRGKKMDVYEGGIHVPGFVNWPSRLQPRKLHSAVHIADWFPTFASLLDYKPAREIDFDGTNIWESLESGKPVVDRSLYWMSNAGNPRWAIRHGKWKAVKYKGEPKTPGDWKITDLQKDPREGWNVDVDEKQRNKIHQQFRMHRSKDFDASSRK